MIKTATEVSPGASPRELRWGGRVPLIARAEKRDGVVQTTRIGGATVLVSEGTIYLD